MHKSTDSTGRRNGVDRGVIRIVLSLLGFAFLIGGLLMLVVPGPGVVATTIGLAILSTQFAWARRLFGRVEGSARSAIAKITSDRSSRLVLACSGGLMLVGGVVVALAVPTWRVVGILVAVGGLVSCAMLLPPVQAWLRKQLVEGDTDPHGSTSTTQRSD
jgi:hypothetical protein